VGKDQLRSTTGLSKRHVDYTAQAVLLLGLAERDGDQYALTPSGQKLAQTTPESEEERQLLAEAVQASPELRRLAPTLLGSRQPTKAELALQLAQVPGINLRTAAHRATMLLSWRRRLLQHQLNFHQTTMWRQVEIKNFRSITSARVRLAPFTVVVGPNGSGKSNFVDALVLVAEASSGARVSPPS
jgi:ABC-type glutathione transport system ATPase component